MSGNANLSTMNSANLQISASFSALIFGASHIDRIEYLTKIHPTSEKVEQ